MSGRKKKSPIPKELSRRGKNPKPTKGLPKPPKPGQSLLDLRPEVVNYWDYKRNEFGPEKYCKGCKLKVYWVCNRSKCGCEHSCYVAINEKVLKNFLSCKFCINKEVCCDKVSLKGVYPKIAIQWHPFKNEETPDKVPPNGPTPCWWLCTEGDRICDCPHEWLQSCNRRIKNGQASSCPFCDGREVCPHTSLAAKSEKCKLEWDYDRNKDLSPFSVAFKSNKTVWWKCQINPELHRWKTMILNRTQNKSNCPFCCNQKICIDNNLAKIFPEICEDWDYDKNEFGPESYAPKTNKKVWWICKAKGHSYFSGISERTIANGGCSQCPTKHFSKSAVEYLNYIQSFWIAPISHAGNGTEFSIPTTRYKADGYCEATKTVFEFFGDFWHCNPDKYDLDSPFPKNPSKTRREIYQATLDKVEIIRNLGYEVIFIWENDWNNFKKYLKSTGQSLNLHRESSFFDQRQETISFQQDLKSIESFGISELFN